MTPATVKGNEVDHIITHGRVFMGTGISFVCINEGGKSAINLFFFLLSILTEISAGRITNCDSEILVEPK